MNWCIWREQRDQKPPLLWTSSVQPGHETHSGLCRCDPVGTDINESRGGTVAVSCHVTQPPAPRSPPGILSVVFCSSGAPHSDPEHSRTPALWQVPFHGTRPTTLWGGGRGHWPGSIASRPPVLRRPVSSQAAILDRCWGRSRGWGLHHLVADGDFFSLLLALCGRSYREMVQVAAPAFSSGLKS